MLFDHLGSAKMLIGDFQNVVWPRPNGQPNELLPFGKDLDFNPDQPDPVESAYKLTFTNKEIDRQLDLHYFGARYYHADLPRFISPDPVSGKLAIPTSWNRYLYCRLEKAIFQGKCWNDPINYFDPDGKEVFEKVHSVFMFWYHTSILIIPDDQERYRIDKRFLTTESGEVYATLGAGTKGRFLWKNRILISNRNRPRDADLSNTVELITIDLEGRDENEVIEELFCADEAYQDDERYTLFPAEESLNRPSSNGHNSNSYTSGLLLSIGLTPIESTWNTPGFTLPIHIDMISDYGPM